MDEWLAENGYTTQDIVSGEAIDSNTIVVTLDDGTEVTIRRKKTGFYVDEEDEEDSSGDDGDGNNNSTLDTTLPAIITIR
jgi:hypothetical protein